MGTAHCVKLSEEDGPWGWQSCRDRVGRISIAVHMESYQYLKYGFCSLALKAPSNTACKAGLHPGAGVGVA